MKNKKIKVVVVMAAFNEERKISSVVNDIAKYVNKIVIVDDGSLDNTSDKVKNKKAVILHHIINLGQGAALQTGFEYAKTLKPEVIITYDADGQFDPRDISKFTVPILSGKYDVVLGSRFLGKVIKIPKSRLLLLKLGIYFTYVFSNIRLTDTHNGFRAFSKSALDKIELKHNRWPHPSEIIYQISKNKFRVLEVPITVRYTNYSWEKAKNNYLKYSWTKGQKNLEAIKIPFELVLKAILNS